MNEKEYDFKLECLIKIGDRPSCLSPRPAVASRETQVVIEERSGNAIRTGPAAMIEQVSVEDNFKVTTTYGVTIPDGITTYQSGSIVMADQAPDQISDNIQSTPSSIQSSTIFTLVNMYLLIVLFFINWNSQYWLVKHLRLFIYIKMTLDNVCFHKSDMSAGVFYTSEYWFY